MGAGVALNAALRYPVPLDLPATQKVLDPDTILLSYCVGDERSHLFVVLPGTLQVYDLGVGEKELRAQVEHLRILIQRVHNPNASDADIIAAAKGLYGKIIAPAEGQIAGAKRILIIPDG